ncbi:MAG: PAS domain-containing protein [Candidatus Obscuribacterales bacterium]|nr:PAS domain-containing protein [Candidatus Obscuribacterales bacterium]
MTNINSQDAELSIEELRRRATILNNLPVGILGADERGEILSISPQANTLLGTTGPELKGKSIFDIVALDDRSSFECFFSESITRDSQNISGCSARLCVNAELVEFAISFQAALTLSGTTTVIICLMPLCRRIEGAVASPSV